MVSYGSFKKKWGTAALVIEGEQVFSFNDISLNILGINKYGGKKRTGVIDKLPTFKKSQEVASNNNDVNKELYKTLTIELAVDRKVKIFNKYVPTALSANSYPS